MIELTFTVFGDALPAGSKVIARSPGGRTWIRDDNRNTADWKRAVAQRAGEAMHGRDLFDGAVSLTLTFVRPRPASHIGKRGLRPSAPAHPTTRPDVTKLARAVEDALLGIVYRDDAQVVGLKAAKMYGEPARVVVVVTSLDTPYTEAVA